MSRKRKRKLEGEELTLDWEQENLFSQKTRAEIESMWEIPQIFHFLYLTKDVLNISHLSMFEMERMLLMPKASKQLACIMTGLLSSPMTRARLKRIPPMPYEFWMNILTYKAKSWFKIYHAKRKDVVRVLEAIGVEPEFWDIFPEESMLDGKDFEELSLKQRVWLLKTVCDTTMYNRKAVQEEIVKQACKNQSDMLLGIDHHGARYIYFPQLIESELRIYRHCTNNKIFSTNGLETSNDTFSIIKMENKVAEEKARKTRRKKSQWKNGITIRRRRRKNKMNKQKDESCNCSIENGVASIFNEDSNLSVFSSYSLAVNNNHISLDDTENRDRSSSLSKASNESAVFNETKCSYAKSSGYDTSTSCSSHVCEETSSFTNTFKGFSQECEGTSKIAAINGILDELKLEINHDFNSNNEDKNDKVLENVDSTPSNSKTDDEKINEITGVPNAGNNDSKSDDEKVYETKSVIDNCGTVNQEENEKKKLKMEIDGKTINCENITDGKPTDLDTEEKFVNPLDYLQVDMEVNMDMNCDFQLESQMEIKEWQLQATAFKRLLKDLAVSHFQLVADSVDGLRDLISVLSSRNSNLNSNDNNSENSDSSCDEKLLSNLKKLLSSVENVEATIKDTTRKAKTKLQKEWASYEEGGVDNQDSSGEGGLASNWWLLGSQGYSLLPSGEATLQALSQSALSRLGGESRRKYEEKKQRSVEQQSENEQPRSKEQKDTISTNTAEESSANAETEGKERVEEVRNERKCDVEEEEKPQRTLRIRGVSSYTENFCSDEESGAQQLEKWPNVETVDSTSCTQSNPSVAHVEQNNSQPGKKDSDKDWILPSSSKRKNKREPPKSMMRLRDRRLTLSNEIILQQMLAMETMRLKAINKVHQTKKSYKTKSKVTSNTKKTGQGRKRRVSAETAPICKIQSVHSELDIKDEEPVFYASPTHYRDSDSIASNIKHTMQQESNVSSSNVEQAVGVQYFIQNMQCYENSESDFTFRNQQVDQYQQYQTHSSFNNQPFVYSITQSRVRRQHSKQNSEQNSKQNQPSVQHRYSLPSKPFHRSNILVESNLSRSSNLTNLRKSNLISQEEQQQLTPDLKLRSFEKQPNTSKFINSDNSRIKTTSLIVLSDSDDEIEMIITEKVISRPDNSNDKKDNSTTESKVLDEESTKSAEKDANIDVLSNRLSPTFIKRMNQGGISITPLKPPSTQTTNDTSNMKLVVVVNETGSHYALALPNGSKLILTSEQVAQIRASNGGKLML